MPMPPNDGVALSCQRSPDGWATNRLPTDVRSSAQIVSAATGNATMAASALIVRTLVRAC